MSVKKKKRGGALAGREVFMGSYRFFDEEYAGWDL
jgi:hypothetical protein